MLLIPPLYPPTLMLVLPPNCMFIARGRSRDRHSLEAFHQPWMTQTLYRRQKSNNNGIDHSRSLEPTSLQRWDSLPRNSHPRTRVLVPATISRGSGGLRTWSTRSRASGDRGSLPPEQFIPPHPPHHTYTSSPASLLEIKDGSPWHTFFVSPHLPLLSPSLPSFLFLRFLVVWCVLVIDIATNSPPLSSRSFMRISLYVISVCT